MTYDIELKRRCSGMCWHCKQVLKPLEQAQYILDAMVELQHLRGRLSKVTRNDVALVLSVLYEYGDGRTQATPPTTESD